MRTQPENFKDIKNVLSKWKDNMILLRRLFDLIPYYNDVDLRQFSSKFQ